jgi:hypothetical protein
MGGVSDCVRERRGAVRERGGKETRGRKRERWRIIELRGIYRVR